jgi:hypothetical protein
MTEHAAPPMPQPTVEHKLLKDHVGTWKVACTFYMDPSAPPMQTEATEVVELIGEFWTVSKFTSNIMGMPFTGSCTMGYEPHTGRFVSSWVDSMAPAFFLLSGTQKGDTITLTGKAFSCMTNSVLEHRTTEKHIGKNERVFEMYATMPDGKEVKMMTNHYRRA